MFARISTFAPLCLLLGLAACSSSSSSGSGSDAASSAQGARFFLPTGEPDNTAAPTIEVDAAGGIHAIYPAYAGGGAYYAYCANGCTGEDQVKVVRFDTDGTVANAMIALDAQGHPQVLLSTMMRVYYASCAGDCTQAASWTTTPIVEHGGDRDVTGEAFALDPQGRPRFMMHTYVAYLGIGQKDPESDYMTCDGDCNSASSWKKSVVAMQIWKYSQLRFDAEGRAHLATVATVEGKDGAADQDLIAYLECASNCTTEDGWQGAGLGPAYQSETDAVAIKPAVALALTKAGTPRVLALAAKEDGAKEVAYWRCDADCTSDSGTHWTAIVLSDHEELDTGLDLALDKNDHPRFVYTLDYNIFLAYCNDDVCESADSKWNLTKVEAGSEMKPDEIFLYPNCNVGAWFLHSPSIALTPDGLPRVGYQARDISGGWSNPDPNQPDCVAGTDMTWSRMAVLSSL